MKLANSKGWRGSTASLTSKTCPLGARQLNVASSKHHFANFLEVN
jgi:hypothetical protein